jgi:hypothetical protein
MMMSMFVRMTIQFHPGYPSQRLLRHVQSTKQHDKGQTRNVFKKAFAGGETASRRTLDTSATPRDRKLLKILALSPQAHTERDTSGHSRRSMVVTADGIRCPGGLELELLPSIPLVMSDGTNRCMRI